MDASGVLHEINTIRVSQGLNPLTSISPLQRAAESKASDMARNGYFSHTSPSGATFREALVKENFTYQSAAENIAFNSQLSSIVAAWMKSPPHRANILDPRFDSIGIGLWEGVYQGHQVVFASSLFAKTQNAEAKTTEPVISATPVAADQKSVPKKPRSAAKDIPAAVPSSTDDTALPSQPVPATAAGSDEVCVRFGDREGICQDILEHVVPVSNAGGIPAGEMPAPRPPVPAESFLILTVFIITIMFLSRRLRQIFFNPG